jgi:prepilin-type N-terminal cleavage/methylation domain-containing protein
MQCRGGFTLIEMLVIIIIIAVMSSLIVPEYRHFADHQSYLSSEALVRDALLQAREMAIDRDTTVTLSYNSGANAITLSADAVTTPTDAPSSVSSDNTATQQANSAANPQDQTIPLGGDIAIAGMKTSQQAAGIPNSSQQGQSTATQIQFRGDGTCDGATLTVISPLGYSTQVMLSRAGQVTEAEQ